MESYQLTTFKPIHDKHLHQNKNRRELPQPIKGIYKKAISSHNTDGKRVNVFSPTIGNMNLSALPDHNRDIDSKAIRKKKKRSIQLERRNKKHSFHI